MRKVSKKFLISFIALLMISFSSFAILSFTLADEINGEIAGAATATDAETKLTGVLPSDGLTTQIDRIIENSHTGAYKNPYTNQEDKNYNVLEISSSNNKSKLETLISNGKFKDYVLDGYRTSTSDDADKKFETDASKAKISYQFYRVTESDATLIDAIKKADFIYIANDPTAMYSASVDFSEDVKNALVNAATVDYKPVMIDSFVKTQNIGNTNKKTIVKLISQELSSVKTKYKQKADSSVLMNLSSTSYFFLPVHGDVQKANGKWAYDSATDKYTASVLTIANSDKSITNLLSANNGQMLKDRGYFGTEDKPDFINFETAKVNDLSTATLDLDKYDYIILEKGLGDPTDEVYNKIAAAVMGGVHLVYDESYQSSAGNNTIKNPAPGYAYILDKVATSDDTPRFFNVLVTSAAKVEVFANASVKKTVKDIADIIINGSYRGIYGNGEGESSTVYTVLEIEPAYPIDLDLARAIGEVNIMDWQDAYASSYAQNKQFKYTMGRDGTRNNESTGMYYVRNSAVKSDSADEISLGDSVPLSAYPVAAGGNRVNELKTRIQALQNDNGALCDYYNWTLSKAKVGHASGLGYNNVKVVHMSTYEFNTSTKTLLDNYDAIYIGGDNSGIKSDWKNGNKYKMYFKYGDTYDNQYWFKGTNSGKLVGNDINDSKLEELKEYAKKLPVIVDYKVSDTFSSGNNGLIDPQSNVYKLLQAIQNGSRTLWGFRSDETIKITNVGEQWGKTVGEYATVFAGEEQFSYDDKSTDNQYYHNNHVNETKLKAALNIQRPRLLITSRPPQFVLGDKSTEISRNDLAWKYEVTGTNVTVNVYIDDNANSRFESDEKRATTTGAKGSISVTLDDDYYGPVYWKVEAVAGDVSTSVTGMAKIKKTDQEKMKVNLLQIMPNLGFADNSLVTLYLCTECQQARGLLRKGNYTIVNLHKYHKQAICSMSNGYKDNAFSTLGTAANMLNSQSTVSSQINNYETNYTTEHNWKYSDHGNNLGIHDHKFGIVRYYDNRTVYENKQATQISSEGGADMVGLDDWNDNLFDEIRDEYDVEVDLMNINEYQNLCAKVNNIYKNCKTANAIESTRQTYADERDKFKLYYDCMMEVINGVYYTNNSKIDSEDKKAFEKMLKDDMKLGGSFNNDGAVTYKTANVSESDVTNLLKGYAAASGKCDKFLKDNYRTMAASQKIQAPTKYAEEEFLYEASDKVVPDEKKYYDFFNMWSDENDEGRTYPQRFVPLYIPWRDAKALEQYFYQKYVTDRALAAVYDEEGKDGFGTFNMNDCWNCIAIGAAERFGDQDINELGCNTLLNYINNEGSVLLFHDTLTLGFAYRDGGTANMTRILASAFGMSGNSDSSHNYITDANGFTVSGMTLTTRDILFKAKDNQNDSGAKAMWKHVQYDYQCETNNQTLHSAHDLRRALAAADGYAGTDKAAQNNEGVITLYPFQISTRLQISATNGQGYVANVSDPNMTVYYSLEGGSPGTYSSMFAADPQDGINNYFLYQYGKVTYTGAGHSDITGLGRNNNDERKLFINVIVNSARKSTAGPSLSLYDFDSKLDDLKNNVIEIAYDADSESGTGEDAAEYVTYVEDYNDVLEFSFLPTLQSNAKIDDIKIFYDVKNSGNSKNVYDANSDVLIYEREENASENVSSGKLKKLSNTLGPINGLYGYTNNAGEITSRLNLKEDYFTGKGGEAAFVVVQLKDSNKKTVTRTIRVELKPELLDLN